MISQILLDFFVLFFHILFFYFCFSIFLEELRVDQSGGRSDIYLSAIWYICHCLYGKYIKLLETIWILFFMYCGGRHNNSTLTIGLFFNIKLHRSISYKKGYLYKAFYVFFYIFLSSLEDVHIIRKNNTLL